VDDAATAASASDLGSAEFHRVDAVALEADVADGDFLASAFLADDVSMIVGQDLPWNSSDVVSLFGSQPISRTFLALLRHHVGEVGEREALADAALAVDRDDLRFVCGPWCLNIDRQRARRRHDDALRRRTEQTARTLIAIGTRNEDALADLERRLGARFNDIADTFVPRHQRVLEPWKPGHVPTPQQLLGARADPGPFHLDHDIAGRWIIQVQRAEAECLWVFEYDGLGLQRGPHKCRRRHRAAY
jgi:hypothetical protein